MTPTVTATLIALTLTATPVVQPTATPTYSAREWAIYDKAYDKGYSAGVNDQWCLSACGSIPIFTSLDKISPGKICEKTMNLIKKVNKECICDGDKSRARKKVILERRMSMEAQTGWLGLKEK